MKTTKLSSTNIISTQYNKTNYVVHFRILKIYLELELNFTNVLKALKFKQAPWLKDYISFNTDKRKHWISSFEKDFFNLPSLSKLWKIYVKDEI